MDVKFTNSDCKPLITFRVKILWSNLQTKSHREMEKSKTGDKHRIWGPFQRATIKV